MSTPATGNRNGYPARVEEYWVDVVPINSIIKLWKTAYLYSVFDSDGQLVGFAPSRALSDLLALKTHCGRSTMPDQRQSAAGDFREGDM